jgi:hypothetical protein
MIFYPYTKAAINVDKFDSEIKNNSIGIKFDRTSVYGSELKIYFTEELSENEITILTNIVTNHSAAPSQEEYILQHVLIPARNFGQDIINQVITENITLGITQAGMTTFVRNVLRDATECLFTGSLYDAITVLKATPEENKDGVYITDARLLYIVNKIELYLGRPLSETL